MQLEFPATPHVRDVGRAPQAQIRVAQQLIKQALERKQGSSEDMGDALPGKRRTHDIQIERQSEPLVTFVKHPLAKQIREWLRLFPVPCRDTQNRFDAPFHICISRGPGYNADPHRRMALPQGAAAPACSVGLDVVNGTLRCFGRAERN